MSEFIGRTEITHSTPFEQDIISDFKLSFLHSQGIYTTQEKMFVYFATSYPQNPNFNIDIVRSHMQEKIDMLSLPRRHIQIVEIKDANGVEEKPIDPNDVRTEFNKSWDQFSDALEFGMYGRKIFNSKMIAAVKPFLNNRDKFPLIIATEMLNQDLHFQQIGRPNAATDEKKWESIARKHVINGISTGNKRIDNLYHQALPFLEKAKVSDPSTKFDCIGSTEDKMVLTLSHLANEWDKNHPGQSFFESY
jgi:hypothetical protein